MHRNVTDYVYTFDFGAENIMRYSIKLDDETMRCLQPPPAELPEWTKLTSNQCENCPLDPELHSHCPVAVNLVGVFEQFKNVTSYEEAYITIESSDRTYSKKAAVQHGLSSLLGILMATSGCPVMDKLRPMVRTHLPFSSMRETLFRVISMYITSQHFRRRRGLESDFELDGLTEIYQDVERVNLGMSERMKEMYGADANINALVILNCLGQHTLLTLEDDMLDEFEGLFSGYFK